MYFLNSNKVIKKKLTKYQKMADVTYVEQESIFYCDFHVEDSPNRKSRLKKVVYI